MKCMTTGCPHDAKWAPKINVPAEGWSVEMHQPLSFTMSLAVCDACWPDLKASDFVGPELEKEKGNMRQIARLMTKGKCPPDFERAWLSKVSINSNEYKILSEHGAAPKGNA